MGYNLPVPGVSWHNHTWSHSWPNAHNRCTKGRACRHSVCSFTTCECLQHIPSLATGRSSMRKRSKAVPFPPPCRTCKEFLRPFKSSLRKLHLSQHLLMKKKLKYTKKSLTVIGNRIDLFLHEFCRASEVVHWQKMLWQFVSLFSELEADELHKMYEYIKKNQMDKTYLQLKKKNRGINWEIALSKSEKSSRRDLAGLPGRCLLHVKKGAVVI
uniref:CHD1 helical C-terminal domain containing 1 n=1 Tax=Strigops habroptila TaxID=2489341 RepID=A0A672U5L8_STRHB